MEQEPHKFLVVGSTPTWPILTEFHMIFVTTDTHWAHGQKAGERPRGIIKHCQRPYPSADVMDEHMIGVLNEHVKETDWLIHNGDIVCDTSLDRYDNDAYVQRVRGYLNRIKCKNITLICGNHDRTWLKVHGDYVLNTKFLDLFCWQGQCPHCGRVYEYYKPDGTWLLKCPESRCVSPDPFMPLPAAHPMGFELRLTSKLCERHGISRQHEGMLITFTHYSLRVWNKSHHNKDRETGKDKLTSINIYGHSHGQLPGLKNSIDCAWDVYHRPLSLVEMLDNVLPRHNATNPEYFSHHEM